MKLAFLLSALLLLPLSAGDRPLFLPFDLTLGGEKAVMEEGNELFAQIGKPVKPDAVLELDAEAPMLIVNAFPCQADGTVLEGQPAAVIFTQNAKQVKLSDTMDKKRLAPGTYLANVVANGATSRIVFEVGEKEKKIDFSKVLGFLRKKKPDVPSFDEWVKGGMQVPADRSFTGGTPWFDESTGQRRTPKAVYEIIFGKRAVKDPPAPGQPRFPEHWGDPPRVQTRDLRPLPGGYGMGSGTLAKWIQENLDKDARGAGGTD